MQKSRLSQAFRAIAAAIDSLEEQEIDALVARRGRLVFVPSEDSGEQAERLPLESPAIIERLNRCNSREEASELLAGIPSREALSAIAKLMKVHVVKHDRRDEIESKIIEFAIGGKLRTEAIQTLNLTGGGVRTGNDAQLSR